MRLNKDGLQDTGRFCSSRPFFLDCFSHSRCPFRAEVSNYKDIPYGRSRVCSSPANLWMVLSIDIPRDLAEREA